MESHDALQLSDPFVRWVEKRILHLFLVRPHLILLYNIAFLWQRIIGDPWRPKGWFPKNYLDQIGKDLNRCTFAQLTNLGRRIEYTAGREGLTSKRYPLGRDALSAEFRRSFASSFPLAHKIPGFFEALYQELIRMSTVKTDLWWHLDISEGTLFLCVSKVEGVSFLDDDSPENNPRVDWIEDNELS